MGKFGKMRPPAWETVMRMPYFKQIDTIKRMSEIVMSGEADAMSFVMKTQWNQPVEPRVLYPDSVYGTVQPRNPRNAQQVTRC